MFRRIVLAGVTELGRKRISGPKYYRLTTSAKSATFQQQVLNTSDPNLTDWTNKLQVIEPSEWAPVAKYRVLNDDGSLGDSIDPSLNNEKLIKAYNAMVKLQIFDLVMFECQRQGRISFYMTSLGEEAAVVGSAAALEPDDLIFAQYRESGVLIYRDMSFEQMINQCLGNCNDSAKGRQMPVHYGSFAHNFVTISSPLTTQLPQAVGAAYSFKLKGDKDRIVVCYFGEGAASEGDTHAAMNFASTLECPVIFFCRNNGYAISTPVKDQFKGDGILGRAMGYGMAGIRVDGNDMLAVHKAVRRARELAILEQRPVLIEAMTYRAGHHSTSDDSSAYRSKDELSEWLKPHREPISRVRRYLSGLGMIDEQQEESLRQETRRKVLDSLNEAEKKLKPPISSMFDDVYSELPLNLVRQRQELNSHLESYGQHYSLQEYEKDTN